MKTLEEMLLTHIQDPFFKDADQLDMLLRYIMSRLYQLKCTTTKMGVGYYKVETPEETCIIKVERIIKDSKNEE